MTLISREERTRWVGASEVAALFGVHPNLTLFELWHIKAGSIPAVDMDGEERIEAGRFLEPSIAAWAAEKYKWPLRKVNDYTPHPTIPGMGASLDFITDVAGQGEHYGEPVEVKNVDNSIFRDPDHGWAVEGQNLVDAPAHFLIQVQHQMACRPAAGQGWIVPCVGGNRVYRMPIPRHTKMIAKIEERVSWFWDTIRRGEEPTPDFENDSSAITRLYKGMGMEIIDLRDNPRARILCMDYVSAHHVVVTASARKQAALAELKTMMQDAKAAIIDGYRIKASHVEGGEYTRDPYWRFNITKQEKI